MKTKFTSLLTAALLVFGLGANAQNLIDNWDGDPTGNETLPTGVGSEPTQFGWAGTNITGWGIVNGSGVRFQDVTTYTYNGVAWPGVGSGRVLFTRWDGTGGSSLTTVYSYPVTLEACKAYTFVGKYGWNSNSSGTSTFTFGINSAADDKGNSIAAVTASVSDANKLKLYDATVTFIAPTTGTYYLTIKNDKPMLGAVADLSITETQSEFLATSANSFFFDEANTQKTFLVTGNALANDITLTAPTGITLDKTAIAKADAQCGVTVTATFDKSVTSAGEIKLTSGTLSKTITLVTSFDSQCFTPLFNARTNLVVDPYLNSKSNFGGWGATSIEVNPITAHCGGASGLISGGSLDVVLTGKLKINTAYRVKAMVKAASTACRIGVYGWSTGQADINTNATITGEWAPIDFTFVTGATLPANHGIFFNNSPGSYIDNWEVYEIVPTISTVESSIADMIASVGSTDTKTVTVSGTELAGNIALALSGTNADQFSIDKTTITSENGTASSTLVTITYTPTASAAHTATLTISSPGAVSKEFALSASSISTGVVTPLANFSVTNLDGNIVVKTGTPKSTISVYDITGKLVLKQVSVGGEQTIALPKCGVYMLQVEANGQSKMVKVVKSN